VVFRQITQKRIRGMIVTRAHSSSPEAQKYADIVHKFGKKQNAEFLDRIL
jgi:hypothetical protein